MGNNRKDANERDKSTEEKIVVAAKKMFTERGYDAIKVRDIAAEAKINVSLVNYYFRSKEKLFEHIMTDNVNQLFEKVGPILNDEALTLREKIEELVNHYIDLLLENPDFPRFIVNEVLSGSNKNTAIASRKQFIMKSHFAKQIFSLKSENKITFEPVQVIMNLMGLIIFPFLGKKFFGEISENRVDFIELMKRRKELIPVWISMIISS